jgi:cytochrome c556
MHERHEKYEEMGKAMKAIGRELKGDNPDLAAVRQNAAIIATFAPQIPSLFPPGTGPDAGKTEAKAEIWQKPEDFMAKSTAFTAAARAFQTAAQGTDLAAIRAAQGTMGKTCKACHDLYREEH